MVALGGGAYCRARAEAAASPPRPPRPLPAPPLRPPRSRRPPARPRRRWPQSPRAHCIVHPERDGRPQGGRPARQAAFKAAKYQATIKTNRGTIVLDLLNHKATCTVNSFIYLAAKNYFNNTPCHRLTTAGIYVLQCGDPTGTGSGGPGYKFANENLAGAKYTQGTVAMANAGPGTNGSQFFLVYRNSTTLPPSYTPFGEIVSGLGIIQNVAKAGTDNSNGNGDGHPKEKVTIESVTITKA